MTTPATVSIDDVRFAYDRTAQPMQFDTRIEAGSICAVMGPSGSGKSTLFALIAGFETPLSGRIGVAGRDITRLQPAVRPVNMVFQDHNLFAHLSVLDNLALGIRPNGRLDPAERAKAEDALARVGLAGFGSRKPSALSGGERQRVALARALVRDKPVLLLDEPFAALGPRLRLDMLALVADLSREAGLTTLMITHQPADARAIADRILYIEGGRILANAAAGSLLDETGPASWEAYLGRDLA